MAINPFFLKTDRAPELPGRLYAYLTEELDNGHLLFDAVDATWFDENADALKTPEQWREMAPKAKVYFLETSTSARPSDPNYFRRLSRLVWAEISLGGDGLEGELYANINGPAISVGFDLRPMPLRVQRAIRMATDLTPYVRSDAAIEATLPSARANKVIVLDVGQASANAVVDDSGDVIAYVDLGAPGLSNAATWPRSMKAVCLAKDPIVILTHWHFDHFHLANIQSAALSLTWIAPFQTVGMGAQAAMAASIAPGKLMVWNGSRPIGLATRGIELERCRGPRANLNRTGIAVWVKGPKRSDPILLPGDGGYKDIPSLRGRAITAFAAAHHGGKAPGRPPLPPGHSLTALAMSYGYNNSYNHPRARSIRALTKAGWSIGRFPGSALDEKRTVDRTGGTGGAGLGHIELRWPRASTKPRSCLCGCTIGPTQ